MNGNGAAALAAGDVSLLVIAKDPRPGQVKTRLCPPCSPEQAARLAEAALADTLDVVARAPAARKVLVLDGDDERWRRDGLEIIAQRGGRFADRLAHAFLDAEGPALLVGMDTPQLTTELLDEGLQALASFDAVLGPAPDGGYWSVGLRRPHRDAFRDVPMSSEATLRCQRQRFRSLGLATYEQPPLRDVDTIHDARAVARLAPRSRFARVMAEIT
jgi:rSAM/selenodomain-associated transferase 1